MKTIARLATAAALALATVSGPAIAFPAAAATQEQPWATVAYLVGGQLVGGSLLYCDGATESWGNTTTYDNAVYSYYYMCP